MKFRQLLPVIIAVLIMGAPAIGEGTEAGTPISTPSPTASAEDSSAEKKEPWADVIVSDEAERNQKTDYYRPRKPLEKTVGGGRLVQFFPGDLPTGFEEALLYTRYPVAKTYLINLNMGFVAIKSEPRFDAPSVRSLGAYQTVATDGVVEGAADPKNRSNLWYRVLVGSGITLRKGYVFVPSIAKREFQFGKMAAEIQRLSRGLSQGALAHIDNYNNRNGWAPAAANQSADVYGVVRDQSAPVYESPDKQADFRYLTDGALVKVLGEKDGYYEVTTMDFDGVHYVPKQYIPDTPTLDQLEKVVVVDRKNQNQAAFEKAGDRWKLISYLFATTGEKAEFKQETSLGHFMAIEKRSRIFYLGDYSKVVEGYAPYALRFNGGGYIHGVPVDYRDVISKVVVTPAQTDALGNVIAPEVTKDVVTGESDPGMREYLPSIGTVPRSHKCVRNYTSHAKFLYEWAEIGKTAIIVIE